jgi:hypothetical protein
MVPRTARGLSATVKALLTPAARTRSTEGAGDGEIRAVRESLESAITL